MPQHPRIVNRPSIVWVRLAAITQAIAPGRLHSLHDPAAFADRLRDAADALDELADQVLRDGDRQH